MLLLTHIWETRKIWPNFFHVLWDPCVCLYAACVFPKIHIWGTILRSNYSTKKMNRNNPRAFVFTLETELNKWWSSYPPIITKSKYILCKIVEKNMYELGYILLSLSLFFTYFNFQVCVCLTTNPEPTLIPNC